MMSEIDMILTVRCNNLDLNIQFSSNPENGYFFKKNSIIWYI